MTNIKVIEHKTVLNKKYINHSQNKNSYIVINTANDERYISYILLNFRVDDYLKDKFKTCLCVSDFDYYYINGFLYINNWLLGEEIENFIKEHEHLFIKTFKTDLIGLYNSVIEYIETENP